MSSIDRAVATRAATQHALITARQFAELGGTATMARHRLRTGRWSKAAEGVFRIGGAPVTWHSHVLAAVLAGGPGAVASHRTAGALHGLDGCRRGTPEVTVPRNHRYRPRGVKVHESTDLHLAPIVPVDGIPTTAVPRTLVDLGAVMPTHRVHLAVDHARRHALTNWDQLLDVLVAHARRGRRGVGALRAILDQHHDEVAVTGSRAERLLVTLLVQAGLPGPVLQHEVEEGGRRYRLDFAYPQARVAIEYDGTQHTEREVWERDHPRQNAIVLTGWTVLRYTRRMYLREPERIVREVRRALAQARPAAGLPLPA
jgi:very-short-patch-repair endonuclease